MTRIYTVGEVNRYIRNIITDSTVLAAISVRGEVSNCKYHSSGHIYFSIKDERSAISCVMFAGSRGGLAFRMKDGDKVVVSGRVDVYERDGRYQLYAIRIEPEGEGLLFYGSTILPFVDRFPKDTELYRIITTKPQEQAG